MATNPNQPSFTNSFENGMNKDSNVLLQPNGTYRDLKNFQLINHDGNNFTIKDALGNRFIFQIPRGYDDLHPNVILEEPNMPIGFISFPDKLIIFSTNSGSSTGGYGEIGICYLTNFGQSVAGEIKTITVGASTFTFDGYVPLYRHKDLHFSKMYKIEGFGFKENDAVERVYWTDNYNQPRVFDIVDSTFTNYHASGSLTSGNQYMVLSGAIEHPVGSGVFYGPGLITSVSYPSDNIFTASAATYTITTGNPLVIPYFNIDLLDFTPARSLGGIYLDDFGTGSKLCGNHQYFYRLKKGTTGFQTSWSYGSFPVHVGKNQNSPALPSFNNQHWYVGDGDSTSLSDSGKSVILNITDIDVKFDTIELACAEYTQSLELPYSIKIVASKAINSTTLNSDGSITIEDFGNVNLGSLTIDDVTLFPAIIDRCKTITTNKNYILVGNITERTEFDSIDFSNATFSDTIYYMPSDHNIDDSTGPNPTFPLTYGLKDVAYTTINPTFIYPYTKWVVTSVAGGNVSYNGSGPIYVVGDIIIGVYGATTMTIPAGSQVRPCFAWSQYTAQNGGAPNRLKYIQSKIEVGTGATTSWDYRNPVAAMHLKSYRSSEKYRFGILFYDKRGNPYYVRWLTDYEFGSIYAKSGLIENMGSSLPNPACWCLKPNGLKIDNLRIPKEVVDKISGFSIVRAECDKTIITQGLLWQVQHQALGGGAYAIHPLPTYTLNSQGFSPGSPNPYKAYSFICPDFLVNYTGFQKVLGSGDKLKVVGWLTPQDFLGSGFKFAWYGNNDEAWSKLYVNVPASDPAFNNEATISSLYGMNEGDTVSNFEPNIDFENAKMLIAGSIGSAESVNNNWVGGTSDWGDTMFVGGRKISVSISGGPGGGNGDLLNYAANTGAQQDYSDNTGANGGLDNKCLVNYIVQKDNQYGGTGDEAKANTVYISTGHFQPITSQVINDNYVGTSASNYNYLRFDNIEVFGGDTFVNIVDYGYGLYNSGYNYSIGGVTPDPGGWGLFFPCENNVNYDLRRGRKVSDFGMHNDNNGVTYTGGLGSNTGLEDYSYNDAYSSDGTPFVYPGLPVNFKNAGRFPFRIRFAGQKYPGELVDSFRVFLTNDYKDVDGGLGEINNLRSKEGKTYYWQNKGVGYVPILERQTVSATAGEATTLGTGGVVDRFDTISAVYGNQHQGSLVDTIDGFVWFDMRNKDVLVMSSSGAVSEITVTTGLKSFFNEVFLERISNWFGGTYLNSPTYDASSDRPLMGTGIIGVYDPKTKTSFLTFKFKEWRQELEDTSLATSYTQYQPISKDFTIAFNHQINKFTGFFEKCPAIWHNHNQVVLSVNNPKNTTIYYAADMVVPTPVSIGDVIAVGNKEYVCYSSGTITSYSATPDSSLFTFLNQTNYLFVENEEKDFYSLRDGYLYNFIYNRVVNNSIEFIINPNTNWPFSTDTQLLIGNETPFTDYYFENETQYSSDLNVKSWKRDYRLTDSGWFNNIPLSRKGKLTGMYIKVKYIKQNWTTDPRSISNSLIKILKEIKSYINLKF